MRKKRHQRERTRRGAIVVLVATMMILLFAMVAFGVDYGLMLKVRTDMQRAADAAALAALQDLIPAPDGDQDLNATRAAVGTYVTSNLDDATFNVENNDIEIGRYDPSTIYSNVTLLNSGPFDAVRVTLRRDGVVNPRVSLFFARVLGIQDAGVNVTATAILQKPSTLRPGAYILPFSIPQDVWNDRAPGEVWTIYGDGQLGDEDGDTIPGNWGTVDIGATSNSTSELRDQMLNGLRQGDLDSLYNDGRISQDTHIDSSQALWVEGDPGLSSGMKSAVQAIHGLERIVPIYDTTNTGGGNNLEFHVVGWAVVKVVDSRWGGNRNTYVQVQKSYTYDGNLGSPNSLNSQGIGGAFSSPVLVE